MLAKGIVAFNIQKIVGVYLLSLVNITNEQE